MNEELQSLIDRAMAAGRSREQIVAALKDNGLDSNGLLSVDSYIKKKSPSDLEGSSLQSGLRPSVSESLSSERVQIGFDESAIQQKKKAIADAAAAQVYTAVAKTGGDLNKIQDKQAFADAYTTYRSMSDDPRASLLPQNPVAQDGQIDFAVVPTLKKGATEYVNDLIKQEQERKAELGKTSMLPVFDELVAGTESLVGGLLKFNEMITGKDSELADFFLDDASVRTKDALINYGLTEQEISNGMLNNALDGNIKASLAMLGSTLVQQLPQYALQAVAAPISLPLMGLSAAGGGYSLYEDRNDLSEAEKMLLGVGIGTAEYMAERLFLGDVNMLRKALGKEGVQSLTKKELGDMMFGPLPKGVRSVLEEGTEEVLTSVAQQTLGKIIAGEDFDPIEIAESAIYGGTAGGGIYLLSRGTGAIVDPENEAKMRGLKNILKRTKKAEQQPDITDAEKEALRRKAQETQEALNALKIKDDELVARMSEEDRTILKDIQTQIKSNMRDIRVAKTEEGKDQLEAELRRNLDKLNQLRDKYAGQEEVGIPSPIVEGQAPVEAQPVEGAGQETPEAGGVLQVPIEEGPEEVVPTAVEEAPVEKPQKTAYLDEFNTSGYRYGQYGGTSSNVFYIQDSTGKVVKEIKRVEGDTQFIPKTKLEIFKWIDSQAGTDIAGKFVEANPELKVTEEVKAASPEGLDRFANIQSSDDAYAAFFSEPVPVDPNEELNAILDLLELPEASSDGIEARRLQTQIALRFANLIKDKNRKITYPVKGGTRAVFVPMPGMSPYIGDLEFNENGTVKTIQRIRLFNKLSSIKSSIEANGDQITGIEITSEGDASPTYFKRVRQQAAQPEAKPEAPAQKPLTEQSDDERIQDLILRSFKHKAFPIIPSIQLKNGEFTKIPSGTTEQELVSALERGEVPTDNGVIKISDIQSVSGDGASVERKEIAPVEEPVTEVVTPAVEPTQEAAPTVSDEEQQLLNDIQLYEDEIDNIKNEILLERGNIKEELDRLKAEIANVRAQKLPADEKRDLIDDLKAKMEDAKDEHDNLIETYKEDIKALQSDIKKAQKRLDKIRQAPAQKQAEPAREPSPMEARAETAVKTFPNGDAYIMRDDFIAEFPALHSFFSSGEIYRRERGASETRTKYLHNVSTFVSALEKSTGFQIQTAKDLLSTISSYKPRNQKDLDRFNQAYIEAERFLAQMVAAQKNDALFKTKDQIIATIKRQTSITPAQKEVMARVVQSLKSEHLFNINFNELKDSYGFASNLLRSESGHTFIHEIGHWGYYNILTAQERLDFMNYMAKKFMDRDTDGLVYPFNVPVPEALNFISESQRSRFKGYNELTVTLGTNARDSYQEYFANHFDQWYTNQVGAEGLLKKLFEKLGKLVDQMIDLFKKEGYNKDLVPFFERIADTTKYGMDKAQMDEIDAQLNEDLNVGSNSVGNPEILSESITSVEKESKLDIRQETMKDRAKKAWRSMWWSDDQRQIRTFKESLTSMLSREGMKIKEFAVGLNRILNNADQETIDLVSKVMDGSIKPEQKVQLTQKKDGDLIFALSNAMREYIDSLSEDIIFDPAFSKLSDELQDTIIKNLGTYLRGTYRFWKDKRFFPGEETIKAAIEEVYNTMYNEKFDELEKLFDVDGLASDIAKLEDQYEQLRDNIIEEERKLPAGEKTAEIKAMIANLEEIGNELKASRKLIDEQKKVMKELLKTDEMTPENIRAFKALKNSYIGSQLEFLAPAIKDDAKDFVKAYLEEAKKIRERDDFKGLGMVSPSSIKIPNKQFSKRKNLPETIKALLGEEKDPIIKFIDTALSLSNIKYKGDMIYKIASQFKGTDFVKNNATRAEVASGEYRVVTDKFSPLNGKYVHKDVFEAITDPQLYSAETAWFQTYLNILLLARKSKVIYNVPTWRKNLTGGWYTMMANGVINPSFFSDMRRRTQLLLDKRTDPETEALLDLMAEYGLLGQGVDANLIGAVNVMYTRPSTGNDMEYLNAFQKLGERVKGFDAELGNKYASVDDYTKLVVFRSEIKSFALKLFGKEYDELTPLQKDEVHAKAAERVKQSTPTFSRLPPFYYKLARMPLGDFLSFEFESIRSFVANFANGCIDIQEAINNKELNQTQKSAYMKSGVARLMGVASVFGARFAVPTILAGLALGDDDELEDDVKALRPNWMEGHSIVPTNITKDGMATVYDYSMEDPYGTIFDVATDPLSFPSHVVNMLNPNMAITFLFNLQDSKDVYGKEIVNSYDSPFTKAYKYSGYTLKSLIVPPFISSAVRDEIRRYELEAEKYSPSDAVGRVASRAVIRDYKYDVASQLYYFGQEFATKKEQYTDLTGIARGNRLAELEEVRKMYKGLINIAIKKGNPKLILDANKNIKRQFKPAEEAYILYGYEIPEQQ